MLWILVRGLHYTPQTSELVTLLCILGVFAYLVAVIDWYSRRVLSWRLSNSMDASFCVDCLEDALREHGKPEVFNSDQGSQFTSNAFTGVLKREGIGISMDGRGRALDNIFVERLWRSVKYEDVYLQGYGTMGELTLGLARYFAFYWVWGLCAIGVLLGMAEYKTSPLRKGKERGHLFILLYIGALLIVTRALNMVLYAG